MSTPTEVTAYHENREAVERANQSIWRRVAIVLALALGISVGIQFYDAGQFNIVKTQLHCQTTSLNGALKDARLAIGGDHNKSDYVKVPGHC